MLTLPLTSLLVLCHVITFDPYPLTETLSIKIPLPPEENVYHQTQITLTNLIKDVQSYAKLPPDQVESLTQYIVNTNTTVNTVHLQVKCFWDTLRHPNDEDQSVSSNQVRSIRVKRGLLNIVGEIQHFLFGVSTDRELRAIQTSVQTILKMSVENENLFNNLAYHISNTTQELTQLAQDTHKELKELTHLTSLLNDHTTSNSWQISLLSILTQIQTQSQAFSTYFDKLHQLLIISDSDHLQYLMKELFGATNFKRYYRGLQRITSIQKLMVSHNHNAMVLTVKVMSSSKDQSGFHHLITLQKLPIGNHHIALPNIPSLFQVRVDQNYSMMGLVEDPWSDSDPLSRVHPSSAPYLILPDAETECLTSLLANYPQSRCQITLQPSSIPWFISCTGDIFIDTSLASCSLPFPPNMTILLKSPTQTMCTSIDKAVTFPPTSNFDQISAPVFPLLHLNLTHKYGREITSIQNQPTDLSYAFQKLNHALGLRTYNITLSSDEFSDILNKIHSNINTAKGALDDFVQATGIGWLGILGTIWVAIQKWSGVVSLSILIILIIAFRCIRPVRAACLTTSYEDHMAFVADLMIIIIAVGVGIQWIYKRCSQLRADSDKLKPDRPKLVPGRLKIIAVVNLDGLVENMSIQVVVCNIHRLHFDLLENTEANAHCEIISKRNSILGTTSQLIIRHSGFWSSNMGNDYPSSPIIYTLPPNITHNRPTSAHVVKFFLE